ncbi:MAG: hypothetical protein Q9162_005707 [Coniocarpon cinnabarinum]
MSARKSVLITGYDQYTVDKRSRLIRRLVIDAVLAGSLRGHSLALEFLSKDARVFATARSADTLTELASKGADTLSLEVDKSSSIAACFERVKSLSDGKLDFLINNAGRSTCWIDTTL